MTTRIITFTGAQGVGKTTMQLRISRYLKEQGYHVLNQYSGITSSISREAADKGFTINEQTTFETQSYIAYKYMLADIETRKYAEEHNIDFIILDRSVLDVIPYVRDAVNINTLQKNVLSHMLLSHYDLHRTELVYVEPLLGIVADDKRSTDPAFQIRIVDQFEKILAELMRLQIPYHNLELGTVEDRLAQIVSEVL